MKPDEKSNSFFKWLGSTKLGKSLLVAAAAMSIGVGMPRQAHAHIDVNDVLEAITYEQDDFVPVYGLPGLRLPRYLADYITDDMMRDFDTLGDIVFLDYYLHGLLSERDRRGYDFPVYMFYTHPEPPRFNPYYVDERFIREWDEIERMRYYTVVGNDIARLLSERGWWVYQYGNLYYVLPFGTGEHRRSRDYLLNEESACDLIEDYLQDLVKERDSIVVDYRKYSDVNEPFPDFCVKIDSDRLLEKEDILLPSTYWFGLEYGQGDPGTWRGNKTVWLRTEDGRNRTYDDLKATLDSMFRGERSYDFLGGLFLNSYIISGSSWGGATDLD